MRVGVLTGGGDCPGLNAVIRGVVRKGIDAYGDTVFGFRDGWRGVLENTGFELTAESTRGILPRGGRSAAGDGAGHLVAGLGQLLARGAGGPELAHGRLRLDPADGQLAQVGRADQRLHAGEAACLDLLS